MTLKRSDSFAVRSQNDIENAVHKEDTLWVTVSDTCNELCIILLVWPTSWSPAVGGLIVCVCVCVCV